MRPDLEILFNVTADLIGKTEYSDEKTGNAFKEIARTIVTFDHVVVFAYFGDQRPIDLYSTFTEDEYDVFISQYQEGPYLLDPFYRAATQLKPGIWRMRELAPDRFFSSEYFRSYYVKTGLAEEVGFFVPVGGACLIVLSLMRKEARGPFSNADFIQLKKAEPLITQLVQHFWKDVHRRFESRHQRRKKQHVTMDLSSRVWSKLNLTTREIAIIELVLQGHSSESIGLTLGIATGTVKVHRRNVYRKLGIASQTQLLSLYLENLRDA